MANSTTPLPPGLLLDTQIELVTPTTVAGTIYGISLAIFCLYVHALVSRLQNNDRKRQAKFMLAYSTVIMVCGLYFLVSNAWVAQDAYIKHENVPGGPVKYIASEYHTALIVVGLSCQTIINTLTSAVQIWRVWIIWSSTRYATFVIVLPSLCFLAFTALTLRTDVLQATLSLIEIIRLDTNTQIAQTSIQGATTILCTLLISLYLIFQEWRQRKLIGKAQGATGYAKVVAMLIESYALESLWLLLVAILFHLPVIGFFTETTAYIEILAYLLVQYRVAVGNAYESQREQGRMSSLHWNHSRHVTTQFGEVDEVDGDREVSVKPEAVSVAPVSSMA